ncbi:HIT-like domain-containing protein [Lipomyces japonicus]|uniref:HIT-like domain-containing protein n=1 Tax=Lipomyces japonicus TaxID=56871 RepID=UPI0034CF92AB
MATLHSCIFCRIIKGEIPSYKVFESSKVYAFLDINPLSEGHTLVIPKYHAAKVHELPDDYLAEILPAAKKIALALGATPDDTFQYNLLQNNGALAHQVVPHVHFHVIPKPNEDEGLGVGWPQKESNFDALKASHAKILASLENKL